MDEHTFKEDVFNILRILSSNNNLTQRSLSTHSGFSLGKTNYLIKQLIAKGFVKIRNFTKGSQKIKKVEYILTKKGFKQQVTLTYYYLKIKEKEYFDLKKEIETISSGSDDVLEEQPALKAGER